ncbi:SEC-C metal-binding domain-containing protein [Effusibacillus dendaii]|uniref:Preprotein translocase subunit SecA n=1 Tax=Effusibacillus dendaii TaxID=2743772 RepID=A0A7I8DA81_9BACL|nr:SEC-C metal-binding domain-containing protein [Effusibacillus dendaii]BCJ87088.1 preprotein translocase subunit SecA [Effusibacillus dendaii]
MDKRLSKKEQKMLLNALEYAKEMRRKMEAKEEEKRWSEFELPLTLAGSLARLTKNELSAIRLNLHIKGASALKKQELTDILEQRIPAALPKLLNKLDETRYRIIKQIAGRGGDAFLSLESHQLDYFKNRGLIFTGTYKGKKTLAMPQEVLEGFKKMDSTSYQETIRRNTEWIKLTQGMLYYYGTLDLNALEDLFKHYSATNLRLVDYLPVLEEAGFFYREIRFDTNGFSNYRVWDAERVKKEHQSRPDLSFYPFTKAQLLRAGEPGFVDRNPSYEAFVDFIRRNYTISQDEADSLVEECVYAIRIGEAPSNLLEFLQSQLEIDELELMKGFIDHIMMLNNNTRQWFIKGYAPNELSPAKSRTGDSPFAVKAEVVNFVTRKKVGRNDPCPCGSGKKFKKCCGG